MSSYERKLSSEGRKAFRHMTSDVDGNDGMSAADREYEAALRAAKMANPAMAKQKKEKKGMLSVFGKKKDSKKNGPPSQHFAEIRPSSQRQKSDRSAPFGREGDDTDPDVLAAEIAAREAARMMGDKKKNKKGMLRGVPGVLSRKKKDAGPAHFPRAGEIGKHKPSSSKPVSTGYGGFGSGGSGQVFGEGQEIETFDGGSYGGVSDSYEQRRQSDLRGYSEESQELSVDVPEVDDLLRFSMDSPVAAAPAPAGNPFDPFDASAPAPAPASAPAPQGNPFEGNPFAMPPSPAPPATATPGNWQQMQATIAQQQAYIASLQAQVGMQGGAGQQQQQQQMPW